MTILPPMPMPDMRPFLLARKIALIVGGGVSSLKLGAAATLCTQSSKLQLNIFHKTQPTRVVAGFFCNH